MQGNESREGDDHTNIANATFSNYNKAGASQPKDTYSNAYGNANHSAPNKGNFEAYKSPVLSKLGFLNPSMSKRI